MKSFIVKPSVLEGTIQIPPSKSHSLRAILFASFAEGDSVIDNFLMSPDAFAMIAACRQFGATIEQDGSTLKIKGIAGKPQTPSNVIDCGNSGQVLRFAGALSALCEGYTVLTGDESIRSRRPVTPLLQGLTQLGGFATSTRNNHHAPIVIKGPLQANRIVIDDGSDSQPISGLLMVAAFLEGDTEIIVHQAGEKPWVALTLDWFDRLGIAYTQKNFESYCVHGRAHYQGFHYVVPGDFSSAAFPAAAALLTNSTITLQPIDQNDSQGDKLFFEALHTMGASFEYDQQKLSLTVKKTCSLKGCTININAFVDAVTILAVIACYAEGETFITGASIARSKECNRLEAITSELKRMGADIQETPDGLHIRQSTLHVAQVHTYHDHRMAMSLAVAALLTNQPMIIEDIECVSKSFPNFASSMQNIGMNIEEITT